MSIPAENVSGHVSAWVKVGLMCDDDGVQWNDVKFFPWANMVPALEDMRGVAAVCGGNKIKVVKVDPIQEVLHPVYEIADRSHISSCPFNQFLLLVASGV